MDGKQESRHNGMQSEISPEEGGNASDSARRHLLILINVGGDAQHASTLLVHNAVDHRFLLYGGGKPAKLWGRSLITRRAYAYTMEQPYPPAGAG
jgi:hypothetical protein